MTLPVTVSIIARTPQELRFDLLTLESARNSYIAALGNQHCSFPHWYLDAEALSPRPTESHRDLVCYYGLLFSPCLSVAHYRVVHGSQFTSRPSTWIHIILELIFGGNTEIRETGRGRSSAGCTRLSVSAVYSAIPTDVNFYNGANLQNDRKPLVSGSIQHGTHQELVWNSELCALHGAQHSKCPSALLGTSFASSFAC